MIHFTEIEVYTDRDDCMILRHGSEEPFSRSTRLDGDSLDDYTEVSRVQLDAERLAAENRQKYSAEVERLIAERYTVGQEIQFAREQHAAGEAYAEYLAYIEECKRLAADNCRERGLQSAPQ